MSGRRGRNIRRWLAGGATAAGLTALATAGLAGEAGTANAGGEDHTVLIADAYGTRTLVLDGFSGIAATPTPSSSVAADEAPQMRLQLAYQRTGKNLALAISLDGFVFEPLDASGQPIPHATPATASIGIGQDLTWGDGTGSNSAAENAHCGRPQNLHQVTDSFTVNHTYPAAGDYILVYAFAACGLTDSKISATLPIKVT